MFVRCHAIETDFANQTTAAAIVTVPTSKPIKAIIGNSTNPIACSMMASITDTKCPVRARRAIGGKSRKNGGRDRDRTCDPYHVKVVLFR